MTSELATRKPKTVSEHLQDPLVLRKFQQVAPKVIGVERFTRIAMAEIMGNRNLKNCTVPSLLSSLMEAVKLGLEPGILGQCYLVPYKQTCQLIVGYKGLVELARRSGNVASVQARAVRSGDVFEFQFGLETKLTHVPDASRIDFKDEDITHFYAIVTMKDGAQQVEVMGKSQVDAIRRRSAASKSGPWVTDYEAMGCKTVLKRCLKLCPASVEIGEAIALDDRADIGQAQPIHADFIDASEDTESRSADDELADKLGAPKAPELTADATEPSDDEKPTEPKKASQDVLKEPESFAEEVFNRLRKVSPTSNKYGELVKQFKISLPLDLGDFKKWSQGDLEALNAQL